MSEPINSLLVEPAVRSNPTDSPQPLEHDQNDIASSIHTDHSSAYIYGNNETKDMTDMASNIRQEQIPIMGQRQDDAGPEDGAYRSVTSPRFNPNNRPDHDTERSSAFTNTERALNHASAQYSEGFQTHQNVSTRLDHDIDITTSMRNAPQRTDSAMERAGTQSDGYYGDDNNSGRYLLPEDDGMGALRSRIHVIRDLHSSSAEKARMVHELMTENYNAVREFNGDEPPQMVQSPSSPRSAAYPGVAHSCGSHQPLGQASPHPALAASDAPKDIVYNLTAEDLKPTFFPKVETAYPLDDADDADTEELEDASLGCQHYKRNVKLQCYTCKKWYTCRFCHDELEDHHLDRPRTENMLCMLCGHPQPAAQDCAKCGVQAALYYCSICKLWDNDCSKSIYHCNDCGICRIGQGLGKDFFHCKVSCQIKDRGTGKWFGADRTLRRAVSVYQSRLKTPTDASSGQPNAIAQSVEITCLHLRKPWSSCDAVIVFIRNVSLSILNLLTVAQSAAKQSPTWSPRFGI